MDLFQIPAPKWHPLDGGRYINTWCGVVTMDPGDRKYNVGLYRGMILSRDKIGVLMIPAKGWGAHYDSYRRTGKPMPVAIVYGWDPTMPLAAALPLGSIGEYEAMGAMMQEPVRLCRCAQAPGVQEPNNPVIAILLIGVPDIFGCAGRAQE